MKLKVIKYILIATILASCQKMSLQPDLELMYETIVANHPGIYNESDPKFNKKLNSAYVSAKQKLSKTSDLKKQKEIITDFGQSFNDTHLKVYWYTSLQPKLVAKTSEDFQITYLRNGVVWVPLPRFYNLNKQQENEFKNLIDMMPQLRDKRAIVFDLRGNTGGDSTYGFEICSALFGRDYADYKTSMVYRNIVTEYRASRGNLRHLKKLYAKYNASPNQVLNHTSQFLKQIIENMEESIAHNKPYSKDKIEKTPLSKLRSPTHKVIATIIVVIDRYNVSAALDFIDEIKLMKSVVLVGQTTKADRLYIETRKVEFSSKLGAFYFPMKIHRNRPRGDNVPYMPNFEYDTSNTVKLQEYIINLLHTTKKLDYDVAS